MPYIKMPRRVDIDEGDAPEHPGELNYTLTMVVKDYLNNRGLNYSTINDILGALESAKLEFYRRVAVPYEDGKIAENGDVY